MCFVLNGYASKCEVRSLLMCAVILPSGLCYVLVLMHIDNASTVVSICISICAFGMIFYSIIRERLCNVALSCRWRMAVTQNPLSMCDGCMRRCDVTCSRLRMTIAQNSLSLCDCRMRLCCKNSVKK